MNVRMLLSAALVLGLAPIAGAQGQVEDPVIKAAIDRGVAYLQTRRDPADGAYRDEWAGKELRGAARRILTEL